MSASIFWRSIYLVSIFVFMVVAPIAPAEATERQYVQMRDAMRKLAPLVGTWRSVWRFYDRDGTTALPGMYTISYVLDDAYLEWKAGHRRKSDPRRNYSWILLTTFDPDSNQYEQTYFFNTWPHHFTETGSFDSKRQEFLTQGIVPREDGVHDEHVRSILSLRNANEIVYTHYHRYSYEKREHLQLVVTLTRLKPNH
jgi:Protein of unknown function (DUF1579)